MKVIERIDQQVNNITELLEELKHERSYRGTERLVQLVVQALLDLGLMVTTALGGKTPKGYSEVGELLSNMGAISEDHAKLLKSMAGMRNILVHAYTTIRRDLIIDSSKNLRKDAPRIAKALRSSLNGKPIDPLSPSKLSEKLTKVLKGRVSAALLFGGKAKGYSMKGDYDIAIYFGRPHTLYELGELVVDMAKALKVQEDQLDVVSLDSATPEIILEALNGKPIYAETELMLFELKLKAIMEWLDIKSGIHAYSEKPSTAKE